MNLDTKKVHLDFRRPSRDAFPASTAAALLFRGELLFAKQLLRRLRTASSHWTKDINCKQFVTLPGNVMLLVWNVTIFGQSGDKKLVQLGQKTVWSQGGQTVLPISWIPFSKLSQFLPVNPVGEKTCETCATTTRSCPLWLFSRALLYERDYSNDSASVCPSVCLSIRLSPRGTTPRTFLILKIRTRNKNWNVPWDKIQLLFLSEIFCVTHCFRATGQNVPKITHFIWRWPDKMPHIGPKTH